MSARINLLIPCLTGLVFWGSVAGNAAPVPSPPQFDIWIPPSPRLHRSESITSITQTRDGYLWLGTARGAIRFDGRSSRIFNPDTTPKIRGYSIADLIRDPKEGLWILTARGSLSYHLKGAVKRIGGAMGMPELGILAAQPGIGGVMAIAAPDQLIRLREQSTETSTILGLPENSRIHRMARDFQDVVWLICTRDAGLTLMRLAENRAIPTGLELDSGARTTPSRSGGLLIADGDGLVHFDGESARQLTDWGQPGNPSFEITCLHESHDGLVWIGSRTQGLFIYSPTHDAVFRPAQLGFEFESLHVTAIFQDRENHVWISDGAGLLHRIKRRIFENMRLGDENSSSLIRSISEAPDGSIWFGTDDGLHRLQNGTRRQLGPNAGIPAGEVVSVCATRAGSIWASVRNRGLYFSKNGARFSKASGLPSVAVTALYDAPDGTLWVGTNDLGLFRRERQSFAPIENTRANGLFEERSVTRIVAGPDGVIWVGTNGGGLKRWKDGQVTHFESDPGSASGLPSNYIFALRPDAAGLLWIGTSRGLCRYDGASIESVKMADNLESTHVFEIYEDDLLRLWLASDEGVLRVDRSALEAYFEGSLPQIRCAVFDEADGLRELPANTRTQPASCQAGNGQIWIPTGDHATILDPMRMAENPRAPVVVIEELRAENQGYDLSKPIIIPPGASEISIRFAGISFADPHRVTFSWRLEGLEPEWVEHRGIGLAKYDNLDPGTYVFQLKAANKDGVWTPGITSLEFELLPPFWRTSWFLSLLIAALLLLVRYVSMRKIRDRLRYLIRERALENERARIAKDMHDDLGANLTQISLMGELLRRNPGDPSEVEKNAARIAERSRLVSQKLDEIVWAVNPKNDSLDKLASYLVHFAEEFLEPTDIHCRLEVPPRLPDRPVDSELRHDIFMAVKEAMNNAVKYSEATEIRLRISLVSREFTIAVEDDGRGFAPAAAASRGGNGLANMRKRAEEHGGRFEIESAPGKGSIVRFTFPLSA